MNLKKVYLLKGKSLRFYFNVAQNSKDQRNSEINTITIVTASAAAVFGFLLLIVLIVAFHRRRLLRRIRRVEQDSAGGSDQYGGGSPLEATLHFLLPSYDEAVRSKPTTDPPTFADVMQEETERLHSGELITIALKGIKQQP